jgi:hypothetical protein
MASVPHPVLSWYSGISAKYLDLIGDLGVERYFIEGDSLLLECFSNQQLDFDPGFQILHAVWLVEKYLSNLIRRNDNVDIIFFDRYADYCVPPNVRNPTKYLLARSVIIQHLKSHAQQVKVLCFPHLESHAFEEYLSQTGCYFAMCSDGASYAYSKANSAQLVDHEVSLHTSDHEMKPQAGLRSIILSLSLKKVDVALLNGLTWQDSKIFAFVIERRPASTAAVAAALTVPAKPDAAIGEAVAGMSAEDDEVTRPLRMRLMLAAIASSGKALHRSPYLLPTLLHAAYLDILPITARRYAALEFSQSDEDSIDEYLTQLSVAIRQQLTSEGFKVDATIVDLLDGRLFRTIVCDPAGALAGLPADQADDVKHLLVRLGSPLTQILTKVNVPLKRSSDEHPSIDSRILPFSHPAFDPHLAPIHVETNDDKAVYSGKLSLELTHWHSSKKKLVQHDLKPKDAWLDKKIRRQEQRAMAQLTDYAASLTGGPLNAQLIIAEKDKGSKKAGKKSYAQEAKPKSAKALAIIDRNKNRLASQKASKDTKKPVKATPCATPRSIRDVLEYDGPNLDRSMDARDDPRVPFKPDGWQIRVLDELDAGHSLLVVAPTSSGKTYIAFYAMEKTLRASDDDVLIYVAPTKALVNQIAAEVKAKYKKNYRPSSGKSCVSIYTRDTRVNKPTKAQILVTVPHMLSVLMMSPANKDWVPRIKSIIFDEVHSISQADDGLVWEQLIMSAPCQIIALSATVGNVSEFNKWLSFARTGSGPPLTLVEHDQRFSDLRKYIFRAEADPANLAKGVPEPPEQPSLGLEKVQSMQNVHPMACVIRPERGLPPDLTLESRDCLSLWDAMQKHKAVGFDVPQHLSPESFFPATGVAKADVVRWGAALKEAFAGWMANAESPVRAVLATLSSNIHQGKEDEDEDVDEQAQDTSEIVPRTKSFLKGNMKLICDLRANGGLPAILFNYNRKECEDMTQDLLHQLEAAEDHFKSTNVKWKAKMAKYQKAQQARDSRASLTSAKAKVKDKQADSDKLTKMEREQADFETREATTMLFDPDKPLDEFSFADVKKSDSELFKTSIEHFGRVKIPEYLISAFNRGIGVHHSGMNKYYRQAVEMFFRRGFLTVLIATGTLSLGINMPTRTVVFAGDSVFLNALNYRQASGRAGRRGFDLLGNVAFHNMPTERILRLMSSRLPAILGHFPIPTLFALRLFILLHGTEDAPYAMSMVDCLLSRARLYLESDEFKTSVQHHVRFSIEYLRSQGLINAKGHPINFASCVSHLYYAEKGALAFHSLLKEGYFTGLCEEYSTGSAEMALRKLMLVLANLFGRRPMRQVEREDEKERVKNSASVVFLKPLPEEAQAILVVHNEQILDTYTSYVSTFVEQNCKDPDDRLPLSKVQVKPSAMTEKGAITLQGQWSATKLRSAFASLSGYSDNFVSIDDLCDGVREGVFLEKAVIPDLDLVSNTTHLNAYLYDFYIHGSVNALADANRVPKGDVW